MIKSIRLKNFQSHADSAIEFNPGFNLILGPSDNGKSSIVRAIEWVRKNRPKGVDLIRSGMDEVSVEIINSRGVVERSRTVKSTGVYSVAGEDFSVFGQDVPDKVLSTLNLDDMNVQGQLDPHYLILETPGRAAAELNRITKLDKVNDAIENLRAMKREVFDEILRNNSDVESIQEIFDSGVKKDIKKLYSLCKELEEFEKELFSTENRIDSVIEVIGNIVEIKRAEKAFSDMERIEKLLLGMKKGVDELSELSKKRNEIDNCLKLLTENSSLHKEIQEELIELEEEMTERLSKIENCPYCGSELSRTAFERLLSGGGK